MKNRTGSSYIQAWSSNIDWKLLIFLLLFLNVKLVVKIAAVFLIYILRPDFKFGFRIKNSRLPLFYLLVIGIAVFNWLISGSISNFNYGLVLMTGILFWVLCILAIHQIKLAVEKNDPEIIHRTILVFFIINVLVSLAVYIGIVWETGTINPYLYQGNYQKYFIGAGDYIKGLTFDTSTTNAVLNAFGVIYFLLRGKNMLAILCMAVLLLTGSNITNLLLFVTLIFIFFFQSNSNQKSIIVVCLVMLIIFLVKISPQNNEYVTSAYQNFFNIKPETKKPLTPNIPITQIPDSALTDEQKKQKIAQLYMDSVNISVFEKNEEKAIDESAALSIAGFKEKPVIPKDSIHTPTFQHKNDTNATEKALLQFVEKNDTAVPIAARRVITRSHLPGKLIALQQTINFFKQHPVKLLTGTGTGNFSSKLAFRVSAMNIGGGYPARFGYINDDFKSNHLDLYLYYFTNNEGLHSLVNSPDSTYDQLLSEYGMLGLFSFVFFYLVFFVKQIKKQIYAVPLLLFMLGAFFIEYWFEQLSVVVFFELLVMLNIKEITFKKNDETN